MTKQKTFKRRVRERMEKTGESYTSARAALIGAEPHGVYPDTSALRFALAEAGVEISEALTLIIAGGAGAACMSFFYAKEDFSHFHLSGWNPFQSDVVAAVERLGLAPDIHETSGAKAAAKALEERLQDGIQIAWVEDYTVIAVVALDDGGARIYDRELKTIAAADLADRRGRVRKQRHRLLQITPGEPDLPAAVRAGLIACANGPVKPPTPAMSLAGIARWAELDKWEKTFPPGKHRDGALTDMATAITSQNGLLRRLQAQGLREAAELLGRPQLVAIADQADANAEAWLELARDHDLSRVRALYERELRTVQTLQALLT